MTDHVHQFPWCIRFPAISRRVCCGEDLEDLADGIHVVAVIVSVFGYNLAMGDADFRSPYLLRRPFRDVKDNDHTEVDVYLHYVPLRFCSQCCHEIDVGHNRFPPIENCSHYFEKLPTDVHGIWSL